MITRRALKKQIEELRQDNATLKLLTRAYMRKNAKLEDDNAMLNASLDAEIADKEKWATIAHKADKRRVEYVRANNKCAD